MTTNRKPRQLLRSALKFLKFRWFPDCIPKSTQTMFCFFLQLYTESNQIKNERAELHLHQNDDGMVCQSRRLTQKTPKTNEWTQGNGSGGGETGQNVWVKSVWISTAEERREKNPSHFISSPARKWKAEVRAEWGSATVMSRVSTSTAFKYRFGFSGFGLREEKKKEERNGRRSPYAEIYIFICDSWGGGLFGKAPFWSDVGRRRRRRRRRREKIST